MGDGTCSTAETARSSGRWERSVMTATRLMETAAPSIARKRFVSGMCLVGV